MDAFWHHFQNTEHIRDPVIVKAEKAFIPQNNRTNVMWLHVNFGCDKNTPPGGGCEMVTCPEESLGGQPMGALGEGDRYPGAS